jgi:rhamnulokinase
MSAELPFLALDIGAASGRAMLAFPGEGPLELREVHRFANGPVPLAGVLYWDFLRIWENILEALRRCAAGGHRRLAGIGVDTWNVDFGLVDARGGLVRNPVSYRSPQSEQALEEIRSAAAEEELFGITGFGYSRITALPRLLEMRRSLGQSFLDGLHMLPLPDLVRHFLCGSADVEETILWGTQLSDIRARVVSDRLLRAFSLPTGLLPRVIRAGQSRAEILPEVRSATGIERATVHAVCGHDTMSATAAGMGIGGERGSSAILCTGSWFILGRLLESPCADAGCLARGFVNEIAPLGLTFLARNSMGFFFLEELLRHWKLAEPGLSWSGLVLEAGAAPPFSLEVDSNDAIFFSSTHASRSLGEYLARTGQRQEPGRGAVARAILEGLVLSCRVALQDLESLTRSRIDRVVVLGGGARNTLLCRMLADCLERTVLVGPAEATVLGNIGMQMAGAGMVKGTAELADLLARGFPSAVHAPGDPAPWRGRPERSSL